MQFYTFAAFIILAITLGQMPQTHADPKPRLGHGQLSPGTEIVAIHYYNGTVLGYLSDEIVSIIKELRSGPNDTFIIYDDELVQHNSEDDDEDLPEEIATAISNAVPKYGGGIIFKVYSLGEVVGKKQSIFDSDGTIIAKIPQCAVKQIGPGSIILRNKFFNVAENIVEIKDVLEKIAGL